MSGPSEAGPERERVLALLRRFGWNATSFQVLEQGFSYWFADEDSCVAYVDTGAAWVAAGAPVAAPERLGAVAEAFVRAARARGRRACFFATEERFVTAAAGLESMRVGEQPVWHPAGWETTLRASRSLREQLRRARAKGVRVRRLGAAEMADPGSPARESVEGLIQRWEGSHAMPPMGFLVGVQVFSYAGERRYFVAEQGGRVVGLLAAVPVFARGGWFFEDLLRDPSAPNGTAESLFDAALRDVAGAGSEYATLGLAPLAGTVESWLRFARRAGRGLYDFEGLRAFKARLRPERWEPLHLSYPGGSLGMLALYDTLVAFSRGGLLRFGLDTLLRVPAVVVRLLAVLLLPWTALLILAPGSRWFPAPWVRWAWVAFDVGLFAALFSLSVRWRTPLARALAALVSLDALVTASEALAYNVPRAGSPGDWAVMLVAVAAPSLAAGLLWRALARPAGWRAEG